MTFKNPANGHNETIPQLAWLWTLLLGIIYFGVKGVWTHVFVGLFLAIVTAGISWFIYPFFAKKILRNHYLKKGWIEVKANVLSETAAE
ncbi:hypothetical protein FE236_00955 [Mariprofundus erugo]|uniref:hypothetical protein n=1 Tax=Mariprofundus erugo TaxID=2528639 RepID=UPI0010FEAEA8|nr:hypothetical protein [Mariprofundus erugo]TLS78352.1 hypothetical protein FE236_00955 [Mariprofundus erugo]